MQTTGYLDKNAVKNPQFTPKCLPVHLRSFGTFHGDVRKFLDFIFDYLNLFPDPKIETFHGQL